MTCAKGQARSTQLSAGKMAPRSRSGVLDAREKWADAEDPEAQRLGREAVAGKRTSLVADSMISHYNRPCPHLADALTSA